MVPTPTGQDVLRKATFTVFENWGIGGDARRYKINRNGFYQIQLPCDSGGPCFDVATGKQTGVQSTIVTSAGEVVQAEQVKMTRIEDWISEIIDGT